MTFSLGAFFNENNVAKLVVHNALNEEIAKIVATGCQLLFTQIQINMFFLIHFTVFVTQWTNRNQVFQFLDMLIIVFERDGYLHSCVYKRVV